MALIKCPECGSEISDKSEVCIKCGCPLENVKSDKSSKNKKLIAIAIISVVVVVVVGGVGGVLSLSNSKNDVVSKSAISSNIATEAPTEAPTLSWKEKWINEHVILAIDAVEDDLLNRDSLQLRKVICQIDKCDDDGNEIPDDEKTIDIVVDFSAENKFGGYTSMKCVVCFEDSEPEIHYEDEGEPFDLNWLIEMIEEQKYSTNYEYVEFDDEEVALILEQQN